MTIFKRKVYNKLKEWKEKYSHSYAALIEGARRVGKSTISEEFGRNEYKSYIRIDFSQLPLEMKEIFQSLTNLDIFFLRLQNITGIKLYERESLIIFDEIQLMPKVREAIKHLVKDGRYDYIETGSLLSIKMNVKDILIPSEEYKIEMNPMDYEEFLWATKDTDYSLLRESFELSSPLGDATNRILMKKYRLFMAIGGMPQAVNAYMETKNINDVEFVKRRIIDLYFNDFFRLDSSGRVSDLFKAIPSELRRGGNHYSVSSAIGKKAKDKDYELLYNLINSKTVLPCYNTSDPSLLLTQGMDRSKFKLYLADTGLFMSLMLLSGLDTEKELYEKIFLDKLNANLGYLYENAVAVAIKNSGHDLYYYTWSKENSTHSYEIDFIIRKGNKLIPIEVKSSKVNSHPSLDEFIRKYSSLFTTPYIISQKDMIKEGVIKHCPIYLTSFIFEDENR